MSFQINIHDDEPVTDPYHDEMMAMALSKARQQTRSGHVEKVNIFVGKRKPDGFLEWQIHFLTRGATGRQPGDWFVLGLVQREPGAVIESHS